MTIKNCKMLSLALFLFGFTLLNLSSSVAQSFDPAKVGDKVSNTKDTTIDALPKIINDQGEEEDLTLDSYRNAYGNLAVYSGTAGSYARVNEPEIEDKATAYAEKKTGEKRNWQGAVKNSQEFRDALKEGEKIYSKEYAVRMQKISAMRNKAKEFNLEIDAYGGDSENKENKALEELNEAVKKGKITQAQLEEIKRAGEQAAQVADKNPYAGMSQVTFKDKLGRTYNVEVTNGRFGEVTYEGKDEGKKSFRGCEVLPAKLYKQRDCFFCPLFAVVYRAADTMATISMQKLASSFAVLIALGLGIWIAFQTLTHVSSITKQDAPKFLGGLVKQSFKFLIAFLLLQYANEIYDWVVNPLLKAGLDFGNEMLFGKEFVKVGDNILSSEAKTMATKYFSSETYIALENFVTNVQREIAFMQSIGSTLMCIGGNLMMGKAGLTMDNFGSGFQMMIQGLVLCVFGFLLSLAFAFYLIDAVVQLGIVGALMPFLIACWPFKLTAQYTNKGFSMLLNSFFVFVFVGLVVSINLQLIDAALVNSNTEQITETLTTEGQGKNATQTEKIKTGALGGIYAAINAQDENKLKELTDISGVGFLILLFCCIFGFKFCNQSSALADKMAGGGMKAIAPGIATMGASAALSAGKKVTQPAREAVADKATELAGNGMRKLGAAITGRGGRHGQKQEGGGDKGGGDKGGGSGNTSGGESPAQGASSGGGKGTSGGAQSSKKVLGQADSEKKTNPKPEKAGGNANNGTPGGSANNGKPNADRQNTRGGQAHNGKNSAETESDRQRRKQAYLERTRSTPPRAKGRNRSGGGSRRGNRKVSNKKRR